MKKLKQFFMEKDEDDLSIYSESTRQMLLEDDALNTFEEAFMKGYEESSY